MRGAGRAAVPTLQPHGRSLGPAWPPQAVQFPAFISLARLALIRDDPVSLPSMQRRSRPEEQRGQLSLAFIQSFDVVPPRERPLTRNPLQRAPCKPFAETGTPFLKIVEPHGHYKSSLTSDTAPRK